MQLLGRVGVDLGHRAADDLACDQECAHVPALDPALMSVCVAACVADGDGDRDRAVVAAELARPAGVQQRQGPQRVALGSS